MRQLAGTPRAAKRSEARNFARVKRELALVTRERDFTPAGGVLCEVILMKYRAIQANDRRLSVRLMCHTLSPAGYYARGSRAESDRSVRCTTASRSRISRYSTRGPWGPTAAQHLEGACAASASGRHAPNDPA